MQEFINYSFKIQEHSTDISGREIFHNGKLRGIFIMNITRIVNIILLKYTYIYVVKTFVI